MTISEAEAVRRSFYDKPNPTPKDEFLFVEAMEFLIKEADDGNDMCDLGAFYYRRKDYGLAEKYYVMAAERGNATAMSDLGYVYYYGRTGKPDYEKAFRYYSLSAEKGDLYSKLKIADMYRNGYFVKKDRVKFAEIVGEVYDKVKDTDFLFDPLPEVLLRKAEIIREAKGDASAASEAPKLCREAKLFLARRIGLSHFFGDVRLMISALRGIYGGAEAPDAPAGSGAFCDALYLLMSDGGKAGDCISFRYCGKNRKISRCAGDAGERDCLKFGAHYYGDMEDFLMKATVGETPVADVCEDFFVTDCRLTAVRKG